MGQLPLGLWHEKMWRSIQKTRCEDLSLYIIGWENQAIQKKSLDSCRSIQKTRCEDLSIYIIGCEHQAIQKKTLDSCRSIQRTRCEDLSI
jgi:hypothetical protein